MARISADSFCTMAAGVFAGTRAAIQTLVSYSGSLKPSSRSVGTLGRAVERSRPIIAIGTILPAATCCIAVPTLLRPTLTVFDSRSCTTGSRAFWLVAYPSQGPEMLFDAHTRSFTALGGVARRGITTT